MATLNIVLVKPAPPPEIRAGACPAPEAYRYDWAPTGLQLMAWSLAARFGDRVRPTVWHLMDDADERAFLDAMTASPPDVVAFSEIDVLVNAVRRLAGELAERLPAVVTVVGGKQTSLLREGDVFPFGAVRHALRGDGVTALLVLAERWLAGLPLDDLPGRLVVDDGGRVASAAPHSPRAAALDFPPASLHAVSVANHAASDYLERHQQFGHLRPRPARTSALLTGTGCPHACSFCQSPLDFGVASRRVVLRAAREVALEIATLAEERQVDTFFSLEPNLSLAHLRHVYAELRALGRSHAAISGFVRVADVVRAERQGYLGDLAARGLRVLSIGLDVPVDVRRDVYGKDYGWAEVEACLAACEARGILVLATAVGDPALSAEAFGRQLALLAELPVAAIDVRLAIALRHTPYYDAVEPHLLRHPDRDPRYFDRQNYRYQTAQLPGGATPAATYALLEAFYARYLEAQGHLAHVHRLLDRHPDVAPFFARQYTAHTAAHGRRPALAPLLRRLDGATQG